MAPLNAFLCLLGLGIAASSHLSPGEDQYEVCARFGEKEWTCKPKDKCRFPISSSDQSKHNCNSTTNAEFVCCSPERHERSARKSKANLYCEQQMKKCKPVKWTDTSLLDGNSIANEEQQGGPGLRPASQILFPYMAEIGFGERPTWQCSGGIISERFILTSASCTRHNSFGEAKWARMGLSNQMTIGKVVAVFVYPTYKPPSVYDNLGLLQLEIGVKFSDTLQPLCLHGMPRVPYAEGKVSGWGKQNPNGVGDNALFQTEIVFIHPVRCNTLRRKNARTPQGIKPGIMMCGGVIGDLGNSCTGFDGSPLVIQKPDCCLHTLVGVSTSGELCTDPLSPGLYSRVFPYLSWIENIVWPDLT